MSVQIRVVFIVTKSVDELISFLQFSVISVWTFLFQNFILKEFNMADDCYEELRSWVFH